MHPELTETDVIIVGLGPTGATLAGLLGQRGVRVAAFDRLPDLYPMPRAIGLDHEAMRILQELRIADRIASLVAPWRPSEYRGMNGQLIRRLDAAPPPFRLGWAPNYAFNQPGVERVLRDRLKELPAVRMECSAEVTAVGQDAGRAWIDLRMAGQTRCVRHAARYLIACDGGSSPVRKQLGIELEDLGFDEHWLVVDAIVNDEKLASLPQTQVQYCEAGRPATFVVGVGNHRRWELMLLPGESLSPEFPEDELWPLLERWLRPGEGRIWRAAAYGFHGLVAREWRRNRILLAGDAAHMTPPFMIQGMVQGMRDALNLAWKLERVVKNRSPAALLDTYQEERRPHVVAVTGVAMALGRVICERNPHRATERDARLIAEQGGSVRTAVRQDLIPGLSAGLVAPDTPGAGTLMPQPLARVATRRGRLDDITGCVVRMVAAAPLAPGDRAALLAELKPLDGVLVEIGTGEAADQGVVNVVEEEPVLAPWLGELSRSFALVRPDHYVYGTASASSGAIALLKLLRQGLAQT